MFRERTRDEWTAFAGEHDCCLEPVLDLDEALDSELVAARGMVVELDQPGHRAGQAGRLPDQAVAHAGRHDRRRARRSASDTDEVLRDDRLSTPRDRGAARGGSRVSDAASRATASCCGCASWRRPRASPPGTIKHYLREGLLPEPVKTSRNMAWYPREFVERVKLIKQLQEERFLPLKVIKEVLADGEAARAPERLRALIELEDRVLERALSGAGLEGPERARGEARATACRRRRSSGSRSSRC